MSRFDTESARTFLKAADVFFDLEDCDGDPKWAQMLNMNDVWGWACADCEYVPDDKLSEVAELAWRYGWAGILYWVSEARGGERSEFHDNNRFIDFVRHEEKLRKEIPGSSARAYHKLTYTLGPTDNG